MRSPRSRRLTARGESLASHRDGRGAPPARRDDREYREYLSEEQRSRRGCIARRMQPDFHHGLLMWVSSHALQRRLEIVMKYSRRNFACLLPALVTASASAQGTAQTTAQPAADSS